MVRRVLALLAVVMIGQLGLWAGATAAAAQQAELHVSPSTVVAGHSVRVWGRADADTVGYVLSEAFLHDATHDWAGLGAVNVSTDSTGAFSARATIPRTCAPGSYTITARIGGGNLGVSLTLKVVAPSKQVPTAVPAGSGGQTAASDPATRAWLLGIGGAGLVLLTAGVFGLARRHRRARR